MSSSTTPYRLRELSGWEAVRVEPRPKTEGPTFGVFAEGWLARQHELAHAGLLRINNLGRFAPICFRPLRRGPRTRSRASNVTIFG